MMMVVVVEGVRHTRESLHKLDTRGLERGDFLANRDGRSDDIRLELVGIELPSTRVRVGVHLRVRATGRCCRA